MTTAMREQKTAVDTGYWPLFRFNPALKAEGKNPLVLDSPGPGIPLKDFTDGQNRFRMLSKTDPQRAAALLDQAQRDLRARWSFYQELSKFHERHAVESAPAVEEGV